MAFNPNNTFGGNVLINGDLALRAASAIQTTQGAGDSLLLQAYDVDGAAYVTFATLTANNTPTFDLATAVTIGGAYVYRGAGTDVALADGGTNASLTADLGAIVYSGAGALALLASTVTANKVLLSGSSAAPTWSTAVYPVTVAAGDVLIASGVNTIAGLTVGSSTYYLRSNGTAPAWSAIPGSEVTHPTIGAATYDDHADFARFCGTAGRIGSGGAMTDAGGGNLDVSAGTGIIRISASTTADLRFFDWAASLANAIPAASVRYVGVKYNGGAPIVDIRTGDTWNYWDEFPLGLVANVGGTLHINQDGREFADQLGRLIRRFYGTRPYERDERQGGLIIGETGTRNPTLSAGILWDRSNNFDISAVDFSAAGTFRAYYRDGAGGFTEVAGLTQWPNTQYDDNSGALATLGANKWAVLWWYLETDNDITMLYGRGQYNSQSLAQAEVVPGTVPARTTASGRLIGRFVFQKSAGTAAVIETVWSASTITTGVTGHDSLSNVTANQHHNQAHAITSTDHTAADLGAIVYATGTGIALLASTITAGKHLQSGASAAPTWTTATFPSTATGTGTLLRADGTNWAATTATFPTATTRGATLIASAANVWAALTVGTNTQILGSDGTDAAWKAQSFVDHGSIGGLSDDDHTQYALLAGRAGGQSLTGGTGSGDDLTLLSTSHGTKGTLFFGTASSYDQATDTWGLGSAVSATAHVIGARTEAASATLGHYSGIKETLTWTGGGVGADCATIDAYLVCNGSQSTALAAAIRATPTSTGAFTIGTLSAVEAQTPNPATGSTISNAYGLRVIAPAAGAGTVTTMYGIQIGAMAMGSTKYGLWVQSDTSYFGGQVDIAGAKKLTLDGTTAADYLIRDGTNQISLFTNSVARQIWTTVGGVSYTQIPFVSGTDYKGTLQISAATAGSGITFFDTHASFANPFTTSTASSFTGDALNADFNGGIFQWTAVLGGLAVIGNSDVDTNVPALSLIGNQGLAGTTHPAILLNAAKPSGASAAVLTGTDLLCCIRSNGSDRLVVTGGGSVVCGGQAALATNATDGFLYVPTCAGTPTGVPTAYTGKVPLIIDTTNSILYAYMGGAWKQPKVAGVAAAFA